MNRLTIPVQIDSIKRTAGNEKARCIYYHVEIEPGYVLRRTRFLLSSGALFAAGVSWAALAGPDLAGAGDNPLFLSPELISQTLAGIDADEHLSLELGYLWVPNAKLDPGFPGEPIHEGDIYRISLPYFLHCYRYVTEKITEEEWLNPGKRFIQPVRPSPQETLAFRQWRQAQILASRERYHQPGYAQFRLPKKKEDA